MNLFTIPLIILMMIAFIFYTSCVFFSIAKDVFTKIHMVLIYISVLLLISGILYVKKLSSQLTYSHVSYSIMHIHEICGYIATALLIIHTIIITTVYIIHKKNGKPLSSKFNIFSLILWITCTFFYLIALYIGIMVSLT